MYRATGCTIVALAIALAGCTASYRTTSGGATAFQGLAPGRTGSIVVGDRGGLLTRLGLASFAALVGGVGSFKDVKSTTTSERVGDTIVTTRRDEATIDPTAANNAMPIIDKANDPTSDLSGMQATLEIASRDLGGDTSGWMFRLGGYGKAWRGKTGLRLFFGLGVGSFTFHDRTKKAYIGLGPPLNRKDDWSFTYIGTPVRVGYMFRAKHQAPRRQLAAEVFLQADFNWVSLAAIIAPDEDWSPSPWHTGLRLTLGPTYVEGSVSTSTMRMGATSVGLEAGLDF